jgi:hypothetical protein
VGVNILSLGTRGPEKLLRIMAITDRVPKPRSRGRGLFGIRIGLEHQWNSARDDVAVAFLAVVRRDE